MKITIHSSSQEEFDESREDLIKALAGSRLDVDVKDAGQRKSTHATEPEFLAQKQILQHWDDKFRQMLSDISREINELI